MINYSEFQVNIFSNNREILENVKVFARRQTTTTPGLRLYLDVFFENSQAKIRDKLLSFNYVEMFCFKSPCIKQIAFGCIDYNIVDNTSTRISLFSVDQKLKKIKDLTLLWGHYLFILSSIRPYRVCFR